MYTKFKQYKTCKILDNIQHQYTEDISTDHPSTNITMHIVSNIGWFIKNFL